MDSFKVILNIYITVFMSIILTISFISSSVDVSEQKAESLIQHALRPHCVNVSPACLIGYSDLFSIFG